MGDRGHGSPVDYLLCNTPLTDPTAPYHSISYLVGATEKAGHLGHRCLDLNLEVLDYAARPSQVESLLEECARQRARIEAIPMPNRADQLLYRHALLSVGFPASAPAEAIASLQSGDRFYDPVHYRECMLVLQRWMSMLSVAGLPGQFDGFALSEGARFNVSSLADLSDAKLLERLVRPFAGYLEGAFLEVLLERPWSLVGLSVNYPSQLPFAAWLCRAIRDRCPTALICIGGTEIAADLKFLAEPLEIWRVFPACDAIVVGEGESVLTGLLDDLVDGREPRPQPGLLLPGERRLPAVRYEDLASAAAPNYELWDWQRYWSPEPVALHSPTRGCYWNRCTFCDYGLNTDLPTSPSRERAPSDVVEDLRRLQKHSDTVYFAVDAMSPSYLRRLSKALAESDLEISWSAELRLEKSLSQTRLAADLRSSGCVSIAFGFESGCQRILDLLAKGVDLDLVPGLLEELRRAGIGAQMMGFIGFPGETEEEALATYDFLERHRENWTLAAIGDFGLTPGAIAAQQPESFGIDETLRLDGEEITRVLGWRHSESERVHVFPQPRSPAVAEAARNCRKIPAVPRPFAGSIDSPHTLLYFKRYGPTMLPTTGTAKDLPSVLTTAVIDTPFAAFDSFTTLRDLQAWTRDRRRQGISTLSSDVEAYLATPGEAKPGEPGGARLEIYPSGVTVAVNPIAAGKVYEELKRTLLQSEGAI